MPEGGEEIRAEKGNSTIQIQPVSFHLDHGGGGGRGGGVYGPTVATVAGIP